jgi:hypothetical protein
MPYSDADKKKSVDIDVCGLISALFYCGILSLYMAFGHTPASIVNLAKQAINFWCPDRLFGIALEVFYGASEKPEIKYASTKLPIHAITYREEIL